jgi:hypothetical protein
MVEYAFRGGHAMHVNTTTVGMKPEDVDRLAALHFASFLVHVPSAGGHEKIKVDEGYLSLLRRLSDSRVVTGWLCHGHDMDPAVRAIVGDGVRYEPLVPRAGNVRFREVAKPTRKRGRLRCAREAGQSVLLPSGDVLLCCADYGMQHVLGNLLESDYRSLYAAEEFRQVQAGMGDPSSEILCRYCEYARYVSLWRTILTKFASEMHRARSPREVFALAPRLVRGIRRHPRSRSRSG